MSNQVRLFTVSIDTECDHRPDWSRSDPLTFENIMTGIPNRLQPVFEATGAIPTYLLTVEVMESEDCVYALKSIDGEHVEFGTHLHSAFIEPEKKFYDYAGIDSPDFQCNCSAEVELAKLQNLTRLFTERFGYRPRSFRAGRYGAGENTLISLEELGYSVDTSVTPGFMWREPNGSVDFRRAPLQVYTPRKNDISKAALPGSRPIIEIPVSIRPRFGRSPHWLRPWLSDVETMRGLVRHHLKRFTDRPIIILNMMFHSMEVIPKASPYPQSDSDVTRYLDQLKRILDWSADLGFDFASMRNAGKQYAKAYENGT